MSLSNDNRIEMRRRALLEAIRFCGGVTAFSKHLKISRTRASNWVNQPYIEIPYEYVVIIEDIAQVSIERLSPFTEDANKVIRRLRSQDGLPPMDIELNEILIGKHYYLKNSNPERPIIIGTDGVLISGLAQIELYKAEGVNKVRVLVLDLEALLLEQRIFQDMNLSLLISEEIAIGLRLEHLLGNHQGRRNDLEPLKPKKDKTLLPTWGEVKGRKDIRVAKILGYSTNTYYRAKQVYLQDNPELIDAMNSKTIAVAVALKKVSTLKDFEKSKLKGVQL